MSEPAATVMVMILAAYLGVGVVFAVGFAWRWAGRLDPVAAAGTPGFRLLILPGAALLWPYLTARLFRAFRSPV